MSTSNASRGKWMALAAAFLGWMFDGFEIGLFPLVARPAMTELLGSGEKVGLWISVITAAFLIGAATGGVLFGWLGDRIGRVRAMTLSVLTYTVFMGLCGFAANAEQIFLFRFIAALGMGGEWSLGVSLVMEIWPDKGRGVVAGLIGAAANVGFLLIAAIGLALGRIRGSLGQLLTSFGLSEDAIQYLMGSDGSGWRLLMLIGAAPALLTFLIRLFVPESEKWLHAKAQGATSSWATRDLLAVLIGVLGPLGMVYLWAADAPLGLAPGPDNDRTILIVRIVGIVLGTLIALVGYAYPVFRYLQRSAHTIVDATHTLGPTMRRMLLSACFSGVALLGTWGSLQFAVPWVDELAERDAQRQSLDAEATASFRSTARSTTQIVLAIGAIVGTMVGAVLGDLIGRRPTYCLLCATSLASTLWFYLSNDSYGTPLLIAAAFAGALTASFYGWLPLYLPELFRTSVRATGQGFAFNFGRILAAVGALQTGNLIGLFQKEQTVAGMTIPGGYPLACSCMSLIYLVGMVIIWFGPETHGKPLPE